MCLIRTSAAGPHSTAPVQVTSGSPPPPTLHHLLGVCDRHGSSVAAPHTACCCCCRCCSRRAARPAGRTPPSCNYDRSYSSGRWQQFSPPPGHSVAGIIHASRPTQARMSISSVWSCPSDRRRQATPACTQVSRRKTEPSLCGQCSEEARQTTLPWCAGPYPIWPPSLAVQIISSNQPSSSTCV